MSTTQPLPGAPSVTLRSLALWRVMKAWISFFATGFVIGMLLLLIVRLQTYGDVGTTNDQIVQRLAIVFTSTLLMVSLVWNWMTFQPLKGGYRIAAGIGSAVSLIIAIIVSIETMRRPMDLVVVDSAAKDLVVQPLLPQR